MIHVYAFAERLPGLPEAEGVDGAPLECLSVEGVAAVFSRRTAGSSVETLRSDAVAHGAVVEALMARGRAVVPVRFGEVVADDAALGASIRERLESLQRTFGRVRDCVEISLRVWDTAAPAVAPPSSGSDYMRARSTAESRRRDAVDGLHRQVAHFARAVSARGRIGDTRECFACAYLVPTGLLDDARRAIEGFAAVHEELTVVCTGPWPPFSFVGGEAER